MTPANKNALLRSTDRGRAFLFFPWRTGLNIGGSIDDIKAQGGSAEIRLILRLVRRFAVQAAVGAFFPIGQKKHMLYFLFD